jgi:hypothetical protein
MRDDEMDIDRLLGLWSGSIEDEYGEAAVYGTLAIALKLMGHANSISEAESQAKAMWDARSKNKYGAAA